MNVKAPSLGLRANLPQFSLLVLVNAFVGGMVGIERSILPALAQEEFALAERTAILSFIAVFGLTKATANYFAGRLGDRWGRKPVLVAGWLIAAPVPFLLMWAPTWAWVIVANVFLGVSEGLTWSTAVIMKIDLAGPRSRGLAMGLNEFAGYFAVAIAAWATGYIAARHGLRPEPFYLGVLFLTCGLVLSVLAVRETHGHAVHEASTSEAKSEPISHGEIFRRTTWSDRNLSSATQAGLVNNLNDGLAWGLFPMIFAAAGLGLDHIGVLAGLYPAVWGVAQLVTGGLSDRVGRKWLIAVGMWVQGQLIRMTAGSVPMLYLHLATVADFDWLLGRNAPCSPWSIAPDLAPAEVLDIVRELPANWLMVAGNEVVGIIGIKTEAAGRAEIGYGVAASRERKGFASAAVASLLPLLNSRNAHTVTAETSVDNPASQRVLDRNGFKRIGRRVDEEDGPLIMWERPI